MKKATGFIEFIRELPSDVAPSDRISSLNELHLY